MRTDSQFRQWPCTGCKSHNHLLPADSPTSTLLLQLTLLEMLIDWEHAQRALVLHMSKKIHLPLVKLLVHIHIVEWKLNAKFLILRRAQNFPTVSIFPYIHTCHWNRSLKGSGPPGSAHNELKINSTASEQLLSVTSFTCKLLKTIFWTHVWSG